MLAQWSWILVRDHWRDVPARLAVAMNVGICSYLIITAGIFGKPSLIGLLFNSVDRITVATSGIRFMKQITVIR